MTVFVDLQGKYMGDYHGPLDKNPFTSGIAVPSAPDHANDVWNGSGWDPHLPTPPTDNRRDALLLILALLKNTYPDRATDLQGFIDKLQAG